MFGYNNKGKKIIICMLQQLMKFSNKRHYITYRKKVVILQKATISNDFIQLANGVQRYGLGTTLTSIVAHLESEEIFVFYKWKLNLPLGLEGDSH
jgi:hypothetical protein